MKRTCWRLAFVLVVSGVAACLAAAADNPPVGNGDRAIAFRNDMRKLWEDHIIYTHNAIISVAAGTPDFDTVLARLMQNQVDLGNAIRPYYGDAAGDKLTSLLKDHISIAGDVLMAAKAGDNAKLTDAQTRWSANGDEIATFLSAANPGNWPLAPTRDMMATHLRAVSDQAVARLQGNWNGEITAFDFGHTHILMMADTLALGIIRQFPAKFSAPLMVTANGEELLSCPVMGTTLPKSKMIPHEYQGKTYYLCCAPCVVKFKANPRQYIEHPATPEPYTGDM